MEELMEQYIKIVVKFKLIACLTFFWQVCPNGFNSLLTVSIFLRTSETSFLIGSESPSSSWKFHNPK